MPACISDCGVPVAPVNGNVTVNETYYLDLAVFSCNHGYLPSNQTIIQCGLKGQWKHTPPICILAGVLKY